MKHIFPNVLSSWPNRTSCHSRTPSVNFSRVLPETRDGMQVHHQLAASWCVVVARRDETASQRLRHHALWCLPITSLLDGKTQKERASSLGGQLTSTQEREQKVFDTQAISACKSAISGKNHGQSSYLSRGRSRPGRPVRPDSNKFM